MPSTLVISFRASKVEIPLQPGTTVQYVKEMVGGTALSPTDMKLMLKGKVLADPSEDLYEKILLRSSSSPSSSTQKKTFRLIATGLSQGEAAKADKESQSQQQKSRVRDDLSEHGTRELAEQKISGQRILQEASARTRKTTTANAKYRFSRVETLPGLVNEPKAREILETLANDPGILACMAKNKWHVGSLNELFPDGKVGESAVCVMGLNENKGQRIKLRIRTDDLKGFRKMLNIRKVLFHELAHNVHSEHNGDFFRLMRQIEKECNDMDWTGGAGLASSLSSSSSGVSLYEGGTFLLGSSSRKQDDSSSSCQNNLTPREQRLRAALQRMTAEEEEIEFNCGCGRNDIFLPQPLLASTRAPSSDEKSTTSSSQDKDNSMDPTS